MTALLTGALINPVCPEPQAAAAADAPEETVILLHGLGRTSRSMRNIQRHLTRAGYRVINLSYPSTSRSIEQIVAYLGPELDSYCASPQARVHFVTHSLGGIILRCYLRKNRPAGLGRVVMLCPPNRGSELADRLAGWPVYRVLTGPAGQQLGTGSSGVVNCLGPVDFELGVIAGNRSLNPLFSHLIPGTDDGTVSVESTKVPGMQDSLLVPRSHTFIMNDPEVARQVEHFLHHGRFDKPEIPEETGANRACSPQHGGTLRSDTSR